MSLFLATVCIFRAHSREWGGKAKWRPYMTKKGVRSFVGLAGYYRKFIPNYPSKAVALTN